MAINVELPIPYFGDPTSDRALALGRVYLGQADSDPLLPANQIQAYLVQEDGTRVAVNQPITLSAGGYPEYLGSPAQISVDESPFAITVLDRFDAQKYYFPNTDGTRVLSGNIITKLRPTLTEGQTVINVPDSPANLNLFIAGVLLQESDGDYSYNATTGNITLAEPITADQVIGGAEIQYGDIVTQTAKGAAGTLQFANIATLKADSGVEVGDVVETLGYLSAGDAGAAKYVIEPAGTGTDDGGSFIDLPASGFQARCLNLIENGVLAWDKFGASTDSSIDSAERIRAAVNWVSDNIQLPSSVTLTAGESGGVYLLKSTVTGTGPAAGDTFAVLVPDGEKVKLSCNDALLRVDITVPAMAGITNVIGFSQDSGDQAFVYINRLRVDGGLWPLESQYPLRNIGLDYNVLKYSEISQVRCFRAQDDNIKVAGFVILFDKVDCRVASNGRNFNAVVVSQDGDGATRTAICYRNCTADTAALHGFAISGGNGTTYNALINCTADNIGRTSSGGPDNPATVATASAYRLSATFGTSMIACGSENSTRYLRASGVRALTVQDGYVVGMGSTEGATVKGLLEFDGLCEDIDIKPWRQSSSNDSFEKILYIELPSSFNRNSFTIDRSIQRDNIEVIVPGEAFDSSAPYTVAGLDDLFTRSVRNPGGDACLQGGPMIGRNSSEWFDQANYFVKKCFLFTVGATVPATFPIATMTNASNAATGSFFVKAIRARSSGTTPLDPKSFELSASVNSSNFIVGPVVEGYGGTGSNLPALSWNGNTLEFTINNDTFSAYALEVVFVGRPSGGNQTFDWAE